VRILGHPALFRLLVALVVLAPLPLGSNRPWAWSLLAVATGVLLLLWCLGILAGQSNTPVPLRRLWPVALPFGLVVVWSALQMGGAVSADWHHPLWGEAAQTLGIALGGAVSVDPTMTATAILRLLCYGGVFLLAVQLGRERTRAREALIAVAIAGLFYAVYGLVAHLSGWERILWLDKWAYIGDLTSTFVNRNAYGAYAGLGVLCCLALFFHALRERRHGKARRAYELAETVLLRALPLLLGAVVVGSALLLSHSRGAFVSTGVGILALMMAVTTAGLVRPRVTLGVGFALSGIGVAVLGVSGDGTVRRLANVAQNGIADVRPDLFRLTVDAIHDAPLTGHGLGAFLPAFRIYRDASLSAPTVWEFAHNVHLETAMDLGLPAAGLLYFAWAAALFVCLRGLVRRRRDQIHPSVALAAATLVAAHGAVDFSIQMPAVAVTTMLLLGVGYAQSWRTDEK